MEQQIRNENFREIELKKSMFNVKMFSLMKKQLFSLVMMLALVVLAGTSAWAQTGQQDDPFWHVNGSTHTLTVTANANSTFSWTASDPAALTAFTGTNTNVATITWSEDANGVYYFDVVETLTGAGFQACQTTTRRVYVAVLDFDAYVFFSDNSGANIEANGALMTACGEGTTSNYGDVGPGTAFSQEVVIPGNAVGSAGDLSVQEGANPQTQRYVSVSIHWDTAPVGQTFVAPDILSIGFDYSINLTDADGTFVSFNNVATATSGTTVVDGGAGSLLYTIPLVYDVQWGIDDVETQVTLTNVTLYGGNNGTGTVLGVERNANESAYPNAADPRQNTSAVQTIQSAPATSVISVN
jgi:hypothetical protein